MHAIGLSKITKTYLQHPTDITFIEGSPLLACSRRKQQNEPHPRSKEGEFMSCDHELCINWFKNVMH